MIDQPSLLDHFNNPGAQLRDVVVNEGPEGINFSARFPVTPYPGGVPHVAGSDTSIAAAKSMEPQVGKMQAEILRLLHTHSDRGLTCDAIERITSWAHQSASARIRELVKAGLVVDSGERRKGRSGRTGRVYRLA